MLRSAASKALWLAKGVALLGGFAVGLVLILGVGSVALAAVPGDPFELGRTNTINNALTKLAGSNDGLAMLMVDNDSSVAGSRALELRVEPGKAPLKVSPDAGKATNLNADQLDGLNSDQIGVNGLSQENDDSPFDSDSPKTATAECPASKDVVGTGYDILGHTTGSSPNQQTDVVVDAVIPLEDSDSVFVSAVEEVSTSRDWLIRATAICAKAP